MVVLKLHRDKARCIEQDIFPLILQFADLKLRETEHLSDAYLNAKILHTLINEVNTIIKSRLLTQTLILKFKFNDAHAITLYKFLINHPIPSDQYYLLQTRQLVIDVLHKQFYKP